MRTSTRTLAALTTTAAAIALLAGCGGVKHDVTPTMEPRPSQTSTAPTTLTPLDPNSVDTNDADAVAKAVAKAAYSYAPGTDSNPNDAIKRARPLLDPGYAAGVDSYRPATGPGAEWETWTAQHTVVLADVTIGHEPVPPATAGGANREVLVLQHTTSGIPVGQLKVLVTMVGTPQGYRVNGLQQTGI